MAELSKKQKKLLEELTEGTYKAPSEQRREKRDANLRKQQAEAKTRQENEELAPVKTEKRTWFKSGAFSNGYDFGDITKTILGTTTDITQDIGAGILGIGEKTIDTGAYLLGGGAKLIGQDKFADKMQNFIEKDLIDEEKLSTRMTNYSKTGIINNILTGNIAPYNPKNTFDLEETATNSFEENSIFGEKTDSLMQSAGQLAGTFGLQFVGVPWWLTTGTASFGGEVEQAFKKDATYGEAGASALISAGAEILTEKISGGISFGGKTLDAGAKELVSNIIANKTVQNLTKFGMDAVGEGFEEVLTEVINNVGKKLTYEDEETWKEILASEESMDAYLESFIGGAVLGGGVSTINTLQDSKQQQVQELEQTKVEKEAELQQTQDVREQEIIQEELQVIDEELNNIQENAQEITEEPTYYHGTRGDFETFDNSRIGQNYEGDWSSLGKGFYFTKNYESAREFGESSTNEGEVNVKEAKLDIKKPYYVDELTKTENYEQLKSDLQTKYNLEENDFSNGYMLIDALKREGLDSTEVLKEHGYDGIIADDEVVVFDSSQIKNINKQETTTKNTDLKQKQNEIIQKTNPMQDDYHTGIRSAEDIKTFEEVINDDESFVYGDFSQEDAKKALEKGSVTVYSSYPIENGVFVSTSKNMARDYAGNGQIYSKEVPLNEVAWINGDEGQYAKIDNVEEAPVQDAKIEENAPSEIQDAPVQVSEQVAPVQEVKTEINKNGVQMSVGDQVRTFNNSTYEVTDLYTTDDGVVRAKLRNDKGYETGIGIDAIAENLSDSTKNKVTTMTENDSLKSSEVVEEQSNVDSLMNEVAPIDSKLTTEETQELQMYEEFVEENGVEALDKDSKERYDYLKQHEELDTTPIDEDGTEVKDPFEERDIEDVGSRKVKAYQYENPEVRPYFQEEAEIMLQELSERVEGRRYPIIGMDGYMEGYTGEKRVLVKDIADFKDQNNYTYAQIEKGLDNLIKDNGAENNAVSKRLEFLINDRLLNGYRAVDGTIFPPNQEYVNLVKEKQITQYSEEAYQEWSKALEDTENLTSENIAPSQTNENAQISNENQEVIEDVAPVENAPENSNKEPELTLDRAKQIIESLRRDEARETTLDDRRKQVLKDLRQDENIETAKKIAKILTEKPTPQNRKQRAWAKFRASFIDKGSVFEDLSLKTNNRELMAKWDNLMIANAKAQYAIGNGVQSFNSETQAMEQASKSLDSIRETVVNSGKLQEFSDYMYHLLNVDRMNLEANAQAKINEMLEANPILKELNKRNTISQIANKLLEGVTQTNIDEMLNQELFEKNNDLFNSKELRKAEAKKLFDDVKELARLTNEKNKPVFGEDMTAEKSRKIANEFEFDNPEFIEWANDIYEYNRALRNKLVEDKVISQETADYFEQKYPHYVPIQRVDVNGNAINVPLDTNRTGVNTPIKKATGGNSDIMPLFDTMASRTFQTYRATSKNSFGIELKKALKSANKTEQTNVESIMDSVEDQESLLQEGKNGQAPTFTVFEDGKRVTYEITQDMYDALRPISEGSFLSTTIKPLNLASSFHRGVLTQYNPLFALTNSIKDFQDVLINSQHPAKTYAKFGEAYSQMLNKGYWYKEYMANGGEQNSYFDSQDGFDTTPKGVEKITEFLPIKAIGKLNDFMETAPRLAEYIASREAGRSIEVSMLDASRVTTNFKAGGDVTKWANRNGFTFLNASIQGFNQNIRNVREANAQGLKGYLNLATKFAIAGAPALLLNALLWDDDEEYEELSDYVKQNYYVVGKTEDGTFIRIPKGRMSAVLQEGANQIKNLITGDDEVDLSTFLELVANNLAPNNPVENNVLSPIIQTASNKTWYGEDLVPTRLQDEPVEQQYDESTDKFSIWLGQTLGVSPYKINYLLDQYSGGIGDVLLPMGTAQAEGRTEDNIGSKLIAPFVNKFTTNSTLNNQNVSDLYTTSEELTSKANSVEATDEDVLKNRYINSIKSEMNELYKAKREIQSDETLSDTEKYDKVLEVQELINELAENSLNTYENVDKTDIYAQIGDREYYKRTNKDGEEEWRKVEEDELAELDELSMDLNAKTTYFNLKSQINKITDSESEIPKEEKRSMVATLVRDSNLTDEQKAYIYGKNYSSDETLGMITKSNIPFNEYLNYASQTFEADKDSEGKSISGSRKDKIIDYVNSLDLDIPQKAMIIRREYSSFKAYNNDILEYVNSLDLSFAEKKTILETLDFTVKDDGTVTWK